MSVLIDIEKKLGDFRLQVNLEAGNEVLSLLGASGSGKSMTLKCIAGIEKPDRGRIIVDGKTLFDSEKKINLKTQDRFAGLMFQNYALFPGMTVKQNILAGTKRQEKTLSKKERLSVTEALIRRFGLEEIENHYPDQISGGQQQRTALARLLVSEPDILLLDEPFSALDSHLRFRMEQEVREVIKEFGKTVILVSHDRDEVFRLSDRVAVMQNGQIEVAGSKNEVFKKPRTKNAAMLTGCKNISPIEKIDERHVLAINWNLLLETAEDVKDAQYIGIRMHHVNGKYPLNTYTCRVVNEIENPFTCTVMLKAVTENEDAKEAFGWELDKEEWKAKRSHLVEIHIPPESILLLK